MKKFQFSLESALRVRSLAVREREAELARARRELLEAESNRSRLVDAMRATVRAAPQGAVLGVQQLIEADEALRRLRSRLHQEERRLAQTAAQVDMERDRLMVARRDARAVEKLRERRYEEFVRSIAREEQKQTDEVAARRDGARRAA